MKRLLLIILLLGHITVLAQSNFQKNFTAGQNAAQRGLYAKSIDYYQKVEGVATKKYEKNRVFQALADSYKAVSDYSRAIDYYTRLLELYDEENRKKIILNLSDLWILTGQYQKVIDNLKDMHNAPDESVKTISMASAYARLGKYGEALNYLDSVLVACCPAVYKVALQNKGYIYWNCGKFKDADSILKQAVILFDINDPNRYVCLANLAKVQSALGRHDMAERNIDSALQWQKSHLGEKHFEYIISLRKKAEILLAAGKTGDATRGFKTYFYNEREYICENFAYMTENERLNFWHSQKPLIDECYLVGDADANFLFDIAVFSKSILTQANINFAKITSTDSSLSKIYDKILENKSLLRAAEESRRKTLLDETENLERILFQKLPQISNFVADMQFTGQNVRKALRNDNDAVVEFVCYPHNDTTFYAALVMRKSAPVKYVPLFGGREIENHIVNHSSNVTVYEALNSNSAGVINLLYTDTLLSRTIWTAITKDIPKNATLYFVPDGIFYNFGIENICFDRPDLKIMRLSSSRVLCKNAKPASGTVIIAGGLDYNDISHLGGNENQTPDRQGSRVLSGVAGIPRWKYLQHTRYEADSVYSVVSRSDRNAIMLTDGEATESYIKANLGKARIVLLSTHGYRFGVSNIRNKYNASDDIACDSSMLLCGLVLSGANITAQQSLDNANVEDGYLTASEISGMDLTKLDLAVLSACQTGLGHVSYYGSAGLPEGLKKAGTNSIVVSLWSIDDLASRMLMTYFFSNLNKNMKKYDALKLAKERLQNFKGTVRIKTTEFSKVLLKNVSIEKEVRIDYFDEPYYWASFILIDGI